LFDLGVFHPCLTLTARYWAETSIPLGLGIKSLRFIPFRPELAPHFREITTQWVSAMFALEESDRKLIESPQEEIVDRGGKIWFVEHPDLGIIGTCALLPHEDGVYELTKMGVLEGARGSGAGEQLLLYVLEQARAMNMDTLFLLTNATCESAIHLYLKHGFAHDQDIAQRYATCYERCDVAMRWHP
jgi:N-acetylglutamate synthase-like GNAT family acetyltransferase